MPPPLIVFCLPGLAIIFLIQILICEAYHFHVTVSRTKRYSGNCKEKKQRGKLENYPQAKKEPGQHCKDQHCKHKQGSRDEDQAQVASKGKMEFTRNNRNQRPLPEKIQETLHPQSIDFDLPVLGDEQNKQPQKNERLKSRRKSVFAESYDPSKDDGDLQQIIHPKTPEEKQWLLDHLRNITLFEHLANDQITTVVDAMFKLQVNEGEYIMKQGDKGSTFYVVQIGVFDVYVKDADNVEKLTHTYNNEGSFGELALLYNQPRAATIIAQSDGLLWGVDGQTFRRIVHKITYEKRMMYENLINNVPMLQTLEPFERANLVDALIPLTYKHNDMIIKQGAEADGMYFIITGGVRIVMKTVNKKEILLKELSNSEYFGELALVTDKPRAASAFAVGDTHLAFLDREAFERLLGPCMEVIRRHIDNYNEQLLQIEKSQEK